MYQLWSAIKKELKLLQRDLWGFAIIFLMPVVLMITITYIQNSVEQTTGTLQLPILIANSDHGHLSKKMITHLKEHNNLNFIEKIDHKEITEQTGKALIKSGKQKILIVIPKDFSTNLTRARNRRVNRMLNQVISGKKDIDSTRDNSFKPQIIKIYFDPALSISIRKRLKNAIQNKIAKSETKSMYHAFEKKFNTNLSFITQAKLVKFQEQSLSLNQAAIRPNAVQQNLPAWALFAIFFIILPLSINLVKEKNQGTYVRLQTLPVALTKLVSAKIWVYLWVTLIQFYLMLLISIYFFPLIGLPALEVGGRMLPLTIVALFSGLAAIGLGVLIGTVAKTHEQAAPFGATVVVLLAAIGGLWFPVFAMPEMLQTIAKISPMNWGLEAFYTILLRDAGILKLIPFLLLLLGFFIINITIAVLYEKKINHI